MPSNYELIRNAIANARPHKTQDVPRWVALMDVFAIGKTSAHELCREHGFDPDEEVHGSYCSACENDL